MQQPEFVPDSSARIHERVDSSPRQFYDGRSIRVVRVVHRGECDEPPQSRLVDARSGGHQQFHRGRKLLCAISNGRSGDKHDDVIVNGHEAERCDTNIINTARRGDDQVGIGSSLRRHCNQSSSMRGDEKRGVKKHTTSVNSIGSY